MYVFLPSTITWRDEGAFFPQYLENALQISTVKRQIKREREDNTSLNVTDVLALGYLPIINVKKHNSFINL